MEEGRDLPDVVALQGEFDLANLADLKWTLDQALERARGAVLTIDMVGVRFIDSSGWRVVRDTARAALDRGGRVTLHGVRPEQALVVSILGLDALVEMRPRDGSSQLE